MRPIDPPQRAGDKTSAIAGPIAAAATALFALAVLNLGRPWAIPLALIAALAFASVMRAERRVGRRQSEWEAAWWTLIPTLAVCTALFPRSPIGEGVPLAWTAWLSVALGALSVGGVVTQVVVEWLVLRRRWLENPHDIPALPQGADARAGGFCALAIAAGAFSALAATSWAPFGALLGGYGALTAGHRAKSTFIGAIGLALIGVFIATAAYTWFEALHAGIAIATGFLLWLARFWRQQLLESVAWTTTGALIPAARGLAQVAGAIGLGVALTHASAIAAPWTLFAALLTALAGSMLVRDSLPAGQARSAHAASAALFAACAVAGQAFQGWQIGLDWPLFVGAACALLAARVALTPPAADSWRAYNSWVTGAVAPIGVSAFVGSFDGLDMLIGLGLWAVAMAVMAGTRRRSLAAAG